jgi:hypothetical protein
MRLAKNQNQNMCPHSANCMLEEKARNMWRSSWSRNVEWNKKCETQVEIKYFNELSLVIYLELENWSN